MNQSDNNILLVMWRFFDSGIIYPMEDYHYKHKKYIMTETEHDFFKTLVHILGDRYYIFPQLHLGTITNPRVKWTYRWRLWRLAFFYSDKYSVDYVICDTHGIQPKLAIELDDTSHQREKRRNRDLFVERILKEADVPLERFTIERAKDHSYVAKRLNKYL